MSAFNAARLIARGPSSIPEYPLPDRTVTIGREAINDIVINDPEISRRHARITYQAGSYTVEDLGSTNGTFVNGRRIQAATLLRQGDVVDFGESMSFTFYGPGGDDGATMIEAAFDELETPPVANYGAPPVAAQPAAPPPPVYQAAPAASPPAYQAAPGAPPPAQAPGQKRSPTRFILGCGCLLVLAATACGATLFLLDAYAPDVLYCGPLQSLFDLIGLGFNCS